MPKQVAAEHRKDFSLKEAAFELSVSYDWLRKRVGQPGGPPHYRRGAFILFPKAELLEYKKQNQEPMPAAV